jgi:phosphopantothenoylcysteine decarboxylase/phosphopantothenate--cysteine ligase
MSRQLRLLIGSAGAISILNLHEYILFLKKHLTPDIRVILTEQASKLIQAPTISLLIQNQVNETFLQDPRIPAPHVSLTKWADLFLILPATANSIGKAANGISDDLLSSAILYGSVPTLFVPSMPQDVWSKKTVQRNILQLKEDGYYVVEPNFNESGYVISAGDFAENGPKIDIADICHVLKVLSLRHQAE